MPSFLDNIYQFVQRLSLGQRIAIGSVLAGGTLLLLAVAYWANQPEYVLLFGNLDSADANRVVESLRAEDVPYSLRESGSAVYVPRGQVYELRLKLAAEGHVSDGQVGYELFDQGMLGMTDFMQKLNLKRALEGELARTIASMRQVEQARVHLVMPERSPFRAEQVQASSSVVLQLKSGARLSPVQVEGITALVAGAVEGIAASDVTVVDTRGTLLSDPNAGDADVRLTSTQLEMQRSVEQHLTQSGQSLLNEVLGVGNAIVRVAATLDFSRSVSESRLIDPESASVISEERLQEEGEADQANSMVRNYEFSRTTERREKSVGDIARLTISVMINHRREDAGALDEGAEQVAHTPLTDEEIGEIEAMVKNAVGFDAQRGDRFAIHQTRFEMGAEERAALEMRQQAEEAQRQMYLRYGLIVVALLVGGWLVHSITGRMAKTLRVEGAPQVAPSQQPAGQLGSGQREDSPMRPKALRPDGVSEQNGDEVVLVDDLYTSKLSPEARARLKAKHLMFEEIQNQAEQNPEETAEVLRTWLLGG